MRNVRKRPEPRQAGSGVLADLVGLGPFFAVGAIRRTSHMAHGPRRGANSNAATAAAKDACAVKAWAADLSTRDKFGAPAERAWEAQHRLISSDELTMPGVGERRRLGRLPRLEVLAGERLRVLVAW